MERKCNHNVIGVAKTGKLCRVGIYHILYKIYDIKPTLEEKGIRSTTMPDITAW
jgi:hypothetical protein